MKYTVEYTPQAVETLRSLSPQTANLLYSWVAKNLDGCADPRAQGKGKKGGGRWRYRVGAYRLVCEIEEERIVVLAVTSDADSTSLGGPDRRGQAKRRAPSVFLKSTAREPVKSAALLIVTALLAFAFVSRASEYLLISQETERLGGFYQATGGIRESGYTPASALIFQEKGKDASQAIRYLEESPYVRRVDTTGSVSVVSPQLPNNAWTGHMVGDVVAHHYVEDVLFYGTLENVSKNKNTTGHVEGDYSFLFQVDEVLVGADGEYLLQEGKNVCLVNPQDYTVRLGRYTDPVAEYQDFFEYEDLTALSQELIPGGRYLLRGSLAVGKPGVARGSFEPGDEKTPFLQFKPLVENGPWYLPAAEGTEVDFSDPRIAGLLEEMQIYDDNQHATNVGFTGDMSALVTSPAWVDAQAHLTSGRWLTAEDTEQKRPVCVVLGDGDGSDTLKVGDVLTMTLRDVTIPESYTGDAFFDNWTNYCYAYLCQEEDLARLDEIEDTSVTFDFEVVGTYSCVDYRNYDTAKIYIPSSFVPETFTHNRVTPEASMVSFSLTGPEAQAAFLAESREGLAKLGFQLEMPESGWENFRAAEEPMKRSSLYNALVFAGVLAAGLAIVTVVYFYMRRRELPIARAMGVPARTCVRQVMTPVLLLAGLPGIGLGAGLGWWWTARNAGETLSALAEFGAIDPAALPAAYLAAMAGIALLLLTGMVLLGAVLTVRRPVLELLQGAAVAAAAEVKKQSAAGEISAAGAPVSAAPAAVRAAPVPKKKLGLRAGLVARFVWRQASRARLKTALTVLFAAGFTIGLAAISLAIVDSQERIDWLYENTPVEAELVRTGTYRGASIRRDTVQSLKDTGYITDFYLEASVISGSGCLPYREDWNDGGVYIQSGESTRRSFLAFEDERTFRSAAGNGANVTIVYHDGWNGSLFSEKYTEPYHRENEVLFPAIVPKEIYDEYQLGPGSRILLFCRSVRPFEVAGYYEGVAGGDAAYPILLPLSACQTLCSGRLSYSKAHVTLDPSLNRQLDQFEAALREIAGRQGVATLRAAIWDEELRQAVAPLEGGLQLMRVLYPVMLVLSLLSAAGISVLFIMTSAKEAAILRIQGTTKRRTQVMLGLQQALTCFVGLIVGLAGVLLYVGSARPSLLAGIAASSALCAAAYLAAAALGAAVSAAVVTGKNPLELLQVKE